MWDVLFNLDLNHLEAVLLAFIPGIINYCILFYVIFYLSKNNTSITFILFLLSLCLWQTLDTLIRMSGSVETVRMWFDLLWIGVLFVTPVGLHFSLHFIGKKRLANKTVNLRPGPSSAGKVPSPAQGFSWPGLLARH